jgi:3-dehydroquinate synthase
VQSIRVRLRAREQSYEIKIGAGLLSVSGQEARVCLGANGRRIAVISNAQVFELYGPPLIKSLRAADFKVTHWLMGEGERHKSLATLQEALRFLGESGLERGDCVLALGGGVVGDLAGFAAAVYLRGIAFIQAPTTLLAQIDASVGGKTAVNTTRGKNLVGAFHQPRLVLIDTDSLATLPRRELTAGWCEAVKQGATGSRKLFDRTLGFLRTYQTGLSDDTFGATELADLIAAQCQFKASIVARDEREDLNRADHRSRRILNLGHTTGHALEAITHYRRFRHGEAVGYGMLVAGEISKDLGMLAPSELELLRDGVALCGPLPPAGDLKVDEIMQALTADKKAVGGIVKWVLLERIGRARIVDGREIGSKRLRAALRNGLKRLPKPQVRISR